MKKICLLLVMVFILTGCAANKPNLGETIIGTWVDQSGYEIQFFKDGKGFIPGVAGKIPDTNFQYSVKDAGHIIFDIEQSKITVGIEIEGETLTWKDDIGEVIYHRKK